jgi:hypothetical protein
VLNQKLLLVECFFKAYEMKIYFKLNFSQGDIYQ